MIEYALQIFTHDHGLGRGAEVGLDRGVGKGLGVHSGKIGHQLILTVSTRHPSPEPLLSLAIRQRNLVNGDADGAYTTVVMKPPELPLHA
jgi:hypothetical protein